MTLSNTDILFTAFDALMQADTVYNIVKTISDAEEKANLQIANIWAEKKPEEEPKKIEEKKATKEEPKKTEEEKAKEELKKASKVESDVISQEEFDKITKAANEKNQNQFDLIEKYNKTNAWVCYAKYYVSHEDANLITADNETQMFVNGIASLAGYGVMYEKAPIGNIKQYDPNLNPTYDNQSARFLVCYDELLSKLTDLQFKQKVKATQMARSVNTVKEIEIQKEVESDKVVSTASGKARIDEDGFIHPIFFKKDGSVDIKEPSLAETKKCGDGISETLFNRLEDAFGSLLADVPYYYTTKNGYIELNVVRKDCFNAVDTYIVDSGIILGGTRISILGSFIKPDGNYDTIFIDVKKHQEITSCILYSKFYQITPEQVTECVKDFFNDTTIYRYIDFGNTGWFDALDEKDRKVLENNLSIIVKDSLNGTRANHADGARFRFEDFKDVNNFSLVSDDKVISPLYAIGATSVIISNNLSYKVSGDDIIRTCSGEQTNINLKDVKQHKETVNDEK